MLLLTVTEFRNNISKYMKLAVTQHIAIKSKEGIFDLKPNTQIKVNPSPSKDPFWDIPENLERLNKDLAELKGADISKFKSWDDVKAELGL
ncbi:MAG: hypothetical protein R3Y61_02330 [Rikenellaceae bacterium]